MEERSGNGPKCLRAAVKQRHARRMPGQRTYSKCTSEIYILYTCIHRYIYIHIMCMYTLIYKSTYVCIILY